MYQACRPAGRLFYLVLAVIVTASSATVSAREEASAGKPAVSPTAKPGAAEPLPRAASPAPQSGPPLTSVVDTVFRADECLNASTWCKQSPATSTQPSA